MFPTFTRELSSDKTEEFDALLSSELPADSLGRFASNGSQFESFTIQTSDDRQFEVTLIPEAMSHTVNQNEAEKTDAYAIISERESNTSWFVPTEDVDASTVLPELRQAFHEAQDYSDREADYRYHFEDGITEVAVASSNPVGRLDEELVITAVEYLGGQFPQKFLLETENGEYLYLRERSGTIKLYEDAGDGKEIFHAFVGREHPGTYLTQDEVLNFISSVDYISIAEDPKNEVPEEAHEAYWGDFDVNFSDEKVEVDDDLFE